MNLVHTIRDEVLFIALPECPFDKKSAPRLKSKILELIHSFQCYNVVLNLEKTSFIDSLGLATIITIGKEVQEKGDLKLSSPSKPALHILEMVRMNKIFDLFPSDEEAIIAFKS